MTVLAVTPRYDSAHRLREQLGANLGMERAIPGYGPLQASPFSTAKGGGMGLPKGCAMLLAPAGNFEAAKQAFQAGADAVYVGLSGWSRGGARGEFDREQLRLCIELAHALGKKVQLADGGTGRRSELEIASAVQRDRPNPLLVLPSQTHATTQRNCHCCDLCSPVVVCCCRIVTHWSRCALSRIIGGKHPY
jgi:hypothetical protein